MSLINPLEEWASGADLTEAYTSQKKANGWAIGEPPHNKMWNEAENTRDRMINHVFRRSESLGTLSPSLSVSELCSGLVTAAEDWSDPSSTNNKNTSLSTVRDACICWDLSDHESPPFVLALQTDGSFWKLEQASGSACWRYDAAIGKTEIELTFPVTPDQIGAVCCNGTNLFVAWSVDSGNHNVTAFPLSNLEGSYSWTVDTGLEKLESDELVKMIVANASTYRIAIQIQNGAGSGGTARTTVVINSSTGAIIGTGHGSYVSGTGDSSASRSQPVSDGTSIYWLQYQAGASWTYYVMSATITDPTTFPAASLAIGNFVAGDTWKHPRALAVIRGEVFIITGEGKIHSASKGPAFPAFVPTLPFPVSEGNQDIMSVYDGLNLWYSMACTDGTAGVIKYVMVKVPSGILCMDLVDADNDPLSFTPGVVALTDGVVEEDASNKGGRLLFDGHDLWLVLREGSAYRITNPGAR